jgi:nucleotide-binding universal stress UspA family protein
MSSTNRKYSTSLRSILVPLDGSPLAEQAIPVAVSLARQTGAKVRFATVEPPLSLAVMSPEAVDSHALTLEEVREQLRRYLASKAEAVGITHGVRTAIKVLRGIPAAALAGHADDQEIDLVVMTTHGRGGISRFWLGSVADQLLRRTTVPVLLLRPGDTSPPTQFHRVLIALDGSSQSEAAVAPALMLAETTQGSRILLTQVIEPLPPLIGPEYEEEERREASGRLEHLAHSLRLRGVPATVRIAAGPGVADQIRKLARAEEADLIVVGTHGARGVERLILGSVADKVVRAATQPVLVVPCKPKPIRRHVAAGSAAAAAENAVS